MQAKKRVRRIELTVPPFDSLCDIFRDFCHQYLLSLLRSVAGRGRPPKAAVRRAGLEVVEKLLTTLNGCLVGGNGMRACYLRPAPSHRWSSWLLALAARRPGRGRRRPPQVPWGDVC